MNSLNQEHNGLGFQATTYLCVSKRTFATKARLETRKYNLLDFQIHPIVFL